MKQLSSTPITLAGNHQRLLGHLRLTQEELETVVSNNWVLKPVTRGEYLLSLDLTPVEAIPTSPPYTSQGAPEVLTKESVRLGMRVRFRKNQPHYYHLGGQVGTVTKVQSGYVYVDFDSALRFGGWEFYRFEIVEPPHLEDDDEPEDLTPENATVGLRVRFKRSFRNGEHPGLPGKEATIRKIKNRYVYVDYIKPSDRHLMPGGWRMDRFEIVDRPHLEDDGDCLMTQEEHELLDKIAEVYGGFNKIIKQQNRASAPGDLQEVAAEIHRLQDRVLAQAAARAYPGRYRLLGGSFTDRE